MMNIQKFECNMIQENCYIVSDETGECIIIDCGAYYEEERQAVVNYIKDHKLVPRHLIVTHGHLDHNFGNNTIFQTFGLKLEVAEGDAHLMETLKTQAAKYYQVKLDYDFPAVDHYFKQDEKIRFGSHEFSIIETPGHSKGSVTFYCEAEHVAFTGDTLFKHSIGRTDFPGGSMFLMIQSLRKLAQLPDNTIVLPGHGDQTSIGEEVSHNPYMDR
ncbi:MAG: MBL fold metallo-hydrolase [Prevotella sp.]|nr:MBL fold metallo-hydrolase [Prevotella sp.]MCI1685506.1 MBL fold metallo-hydrolase [Prevotella sp.]MCI1780795.1 MBL fold metallo-hydrolase [Prevotella sp.]MCI1802178.1 MBL fold metallo-hydrolase [Prevotella sp.]MCI1847593.1 MBL fold metallo-hydrolase [Prevotella sp.]MCI2181039.1 MBL fold metallo-hydrolase [Prevotella sp.]